MSTKFDITIDVNLSAAGINRAIRQIERFRKQLNQWIDDLMRQLTGEGATIAQMNVMHMNAVYTGRLEENIKGVFFPEERMGYVMADTPYAIFVEYGTGVVGAASPHPDVMSGEADVQPYVYKGKAYTGYDSQGHGDKGWVYFLATDGINEFRWTKGMVSRPFMYETLRWLQENAPNIAKDEPFKQ